MNPANVSESLLIKAVRYTDDNMQMPPEGKLPDEEIQVLEEWVATGAFDPRTEDHPEVEEPEVDWRQHWAFQQPRLANRVEEVDPRSHDVIDAVALRTMRKPESLHREPPIEKRGFDVFIST
ncbi:MAG: hypothetical protein R3C05_13140 [Pirellulaceae bacterium]